MWPTIQAGKQTLMLGTQDHTDRPGEAHPRDTALEQTHASQKQSGEQYTHVPTPPGSPMADCRGGRAPTASQPTTSRWLVPLSEALPPPLSQLRASKNDVKSLLLNVPFWKM